MIGGECISIENVENVSNTVIHPQHDVDLNIIYEDTDILVINKSSNMVVHPGAGHYMNTILNGLLYRYPSMLRISERAGIVHRLDKDTTGLMVIAKTVIAYNNLLQLFKTRQVVKEYEGVVLGRLLCDTGVIDKSIQRNTIRRTCMMVHPMGKIAITRYTVVERFQMYSRIRIYPETGRTHQIRVHMAYINHPLVGDQKYGSSAIISVTNKNISKSNELYRCLSVFKRQALHACTLQCLHPITRVKMKWNAPLPHDMRYLIYMLRKNEELYK